VLPAGTRNSPKSRSASASAFVRGESVGFDDWEVVGEEEVLAASEGFGGADVQATSRDTAVAITRAPTERRTHSTVPLTFHVER
jgi:hypothetical protein